MAADELDELDWVVWNLEVSDPGELTEPGVSERTTPAVTQMAGSPGCVFIQCSDDDAVDGVPYYSWLVRVPREEHLRRDDQGVPVVVGALHAHLRTQVPERVDQWRVYPDRGLSRRDEAGRVLRHAYDDLLDPLETVLLGLRRDGAHEMDPEARCWWRSNDRTALAGTYTLWLCQDPDVDGAARWLLVNAGLAVTDTFWDGRHGQGLRRFGVKPDSPVLVWPRPVAHQWLITVTTGSFMIPPTASRPDAVGASYRWTSRDGTALAHRVGVDLRALLHGGH
ncbi:hypothetical protein DMB66_15900 [Actinoplanes sp. ATCC 53533]|uniref:hypothetical protein n=1 Tax=Actinoplanes sp. ATCC 53533 TaxID=1288362 RepID=UPI000F7A0FD3|nr:hypothetical protein [Actinoplanes sp. ATCC 53533]RSM67437.1 hypothetical protein DMB66_15900 [Actinoplanes sp. ATCC 53533]